MPHVVPPPDDSLRAVAREAAQRMAALRGRPELARPEAVAGLARFLIVAARIEAAAASAESETGGVDSAA
jgi:hypothetical protein